MGIKLRLHPLDLKKATEDLAIKSMGAASEIILPLLQHAGAASIAKVSVGEYVKIGSLVAEAQGYISAQLHASVSGEVQAIENRPHPLLGQYKAIVIKSDGQDLKDSSVQQRDNPDALSAQQIKNIIRDCGIVGLGGAGFPTHVKLSPPKDKVIDSFILNGAECEPYLTCDYRLMLEKAKEIILGMKMAMKVLGLDTAFVAIEKNKPQAIRLFQQLTAGEAIKVTVIKSFYPQGAEKQLIKTVLAREVPAGKLPFDVGVLVHNVATCLAIYEAVYKNKPLYERVITVTGSLVNNPGNILVRIGTKLEDIITFCGGLKQEPAKVILGGPMMGVAQCTLSAPAIKGTSGIIVFSKKESQACTKQACIRCAKCVKVCPMGLNPSAIARAIEKGRFDLAKEYNVLDCVECGICSYVCPANSNVVGLVKLAKHRLAQMKAHR